VGAGAGFRNLFWRAPNGDGARGCTLKWSAVCETAFDGWANSSAATPPESEYERVFPGAFTGPAARDRPYADTGIFEIWAQKKKAIEVRRE
jgi:hypothetical protein